MKYTEYGLQISLEELRAMLEYAENRAEHGKMENCIYIKGGVKPKITQYCSYAGCNPINHTINVQHTRAGAVTPAESRRALKTYYTVDFAVMGKGGTSTHTFDNKADADKFYNAGSHRDAPVAHRVSNPKTIAQYDEQVAMTKYAQRETI